MAAGYAEILRTRHAARLLAGTLTGRLPNATAAIAVVLFVRAEGGSYSLAGALTAVYGVATAVGQPLLGRAVDLYGQPRVTLPASVLAALGMVLLAVVGIEPVAVAYAAVLVAGLATPPLEASLMIGRVQASREGWVDGVARGVGAGSWRLGQCPG